MDKPPRAPFDWSKIRWVGKWTNLAALSFAQRVEALFDEERAKATPPEEAS